MRTGSALGLLMCCFVLAGCAAQAPGNAWLTPGAERLVELASSERQWTGIAVSKEERIFVAFPRWSRSQPFAVGELQPDGTVTPYPNEFLNSWTLAKVPQDHFVCVHSLFASPDNRLWILDAGNPGFRGVIEGAPKLVVVDLNSNEVIRVYRFCSKVLRPDSYLCDLQVDVERGAVYMTDWGNGALLVIDLPTGRTRRLLDEHPSTEAREPLTVDGRQWRPSGAPPRFDAHGIALSLDGEWLYYQPLSSSSLYRVPTAALRNSHLPTEELASRVEKVAETGISDGIISGPDGNLYGADPVHNAIRRLSPTGRAETLFHDKRLSWPDSLALGPDNSLYLTTASLHQGNSPTGPFRIFRIPAE